MTLLENIDGNKLYGYKDGTIERVVRCDGPVYWIAYDYNGEEIGEYNRLKDAKLAVETIVMV